jgi:trehalose-6-phosphate synthase
LEFVRQRELIDGLLGADLIAFHTQTHCNNYWRPWTEPWKR